ncbi:unnamed protein product [Ectocarpus sp. CCAP 1310/34]|nr:unnamed protein product [Ectocarpus sp. CCAP 1310/34]
MMSTTKMRPLVGMLSGGRASVLTARAGAGLKPGGAPSTMLHLAAAIRGIKVLGNSRTEKHLLDEFRSVKGPQSGEISWKKRPLFRPGRGEGFFRTGAEAADMLYAEALRVGPHDQIFLETVRDVLDSVAPVIDRWPQYAWVAKRLLEAERALSFRVAWLDDKGIIRVNRGYRYQYSSALGPFVGPLHFSKELTAADVKAHAFDLVLSNSLSGLKVGASVGGADFNVHDKSEAEIQRFCQAYMSAMTKHIGTEVDCPSMGLCVGPPEIGYLYGQYKRISLDASPIGRGLLWGGAVPHPECAGYGVVYFAEKAMRGQGESLMGKRCIITGSGKVALHVAEKLLELGATPMTFTDSSGHVFEPEGFDVEKFKKITKIKQERGARVGRYIVASPSAKYNEPQSVFDAPADVAFLCRTSNELTEVEANALVASGCKTVVDGGYRPVSTAAAEVLKTNGIFHVPYRGTLIGAAISGGRELDRNPLKPGETIDDRLEKKMDEVYEVASSVAREFNQQGNLDKGCTIAGFLRVGRAMMAHGAV